MAHKRMSEMTEEERVARRRMRSESRRSSTYKEFLRELQRRGGLSEELAEQAAVSVLCALEQRLLADEARDLEAQLPRNLQSLLYRCERHELLEPEQKFGRDELLSMVGEDLGMSESEVEPVVEAVFETVAAHVTPGEIEDVVSQLPPDLKAMWPAPTTARAEDAGLEQQSP